MKSKIFKTPFFNLTILALLALPVLSFLYVSLDFPSLQLSRDLKKTKLTKLVTSSEPVEKESLFEFALSETFSSERLKSLATKHAREFQSNTPFPHIVIDNFVDPTLLKLVEREVLKKNYEKKCAALGNKVGITKEDTTKLHCFYNEFKVRGGNVFERNEYKKLAVYSEDYFGALTRFLFLLFKSSTFTTFLEDISGIDNVIPDPHFRGSGLHSTAPHGFLRVHADFNRYERYKLDRRINVFLFLNSEWKERWGGALELWPRNMSTCERKIQPIFNRLVIFKTTDFSYHGYTDPLTSPFPRRSMAMYYYTNGRPDDEKVDKGDHSHSTLWQEVPCKMQGLESLGPKCSNKFKFKY